MSLREEIAECYYYERYHCSTSISWEEIKSSHIGMYVVKDCYKRAEEKMTEINNGN